MKQCVILSLLCASIVYVSSVKIQFPETNPCMIVELDAESRIDLTNGTGYKVSYNFSQATLQTAGSSCEGSMHILNVNVGEGVLDMSFILGSNQEVTVNILYKFTPSDVFPGDSDNTQAIADDISNELTSQSGRSYKCMTEERIQFGAAGKNYTCELYIKGVQVQGFNVTNGEFSEATVCAADATSTTEHSNHTTAGTNGTTSEVTTAHSNGTTSEVTTVPANGTTSHSNATTQSSTAAPTTQPTTPAPVPQEKQYELREGNDTCIVFKAAISLNITYLKKDGKTGFSIFAVPNTTTVDTARSFCNSTSRSQSLALTFFDNWILSMVFSLDSSTSMLAKAADDKYALQTVTLTYELNEERFPGTNETGLVNVVTTMDKGTLEAAGSYVCDKETKLNLNNSITMDTKNLQYQAFGTGNFTKFSTNVTECPSDTDTNSIVPIAVGAALAGLVIIVLIAYLIGRKRSRGGYEQV